jgi:hypothetical protein
VPDHDHDHDHDHAEEAAVDETPVAATEAHDAPADETEATDGDEAGEE